jgi:hypothetical protein
MINIQAQGSKVTVDLQNQGVAPFTATIGTVQFNFSGGDYLESITYKSNTIYNNTVDMSPATISNWITGSDMTLQAATTSTMVFYFNKNVSTFDITSILFHTPVGDCYKP